ncbi:MAG: Gfo/Idh/MocA family protein [Pirellulaceae bacterium]
MRTIHFGIIGCGLMGREFASASARWCHLLGIDARPEIVAVSDRNPAPFDWFRQHFPVVRQYADDYRELLANPAVEAAYVAVPHHLHQDICCAAIEAGKHVMAEKPVGVDMAANRAIADCAARHPEVFVRCASQWMFYPAAQRIGELLESGSVGRVIEVNAGFQHSSDLDPDKPINWKRMIEFNGEYGVMGDLGMHVCALPFRAGWLPHNVRAILSDIIKERPDGKGSNVPCRTWDNATLLCETTDPGSGEPFPLTFKMQRIAPGQKNTWYLEILGTRSSVRYSTRDPKRLEWLEYTGGEAVWSHLQTGHETAFKTITGPIFEFGFADSILQMWAAFVYELIHGLPPKRFAGCVTLEEVGLSHRLFTAALTSQQNQTVERV